MAEVSNMETFEEDHIRQATKTGWWRTYILPATWQRESKDKKTRTVQLNLRDYKTLSCPKQQQRGNKDKTKEIWRTWRTIPVQNQSNVAEPFAPYHLTGSLLVVAALSTVAAGSGAAAATHGGIGEDQFSQHDCPEWQKQKYRFQKKVLFQLQGQGLPMATVTKKVVRIFPLKQSRIDKCSFLETCTRQFPMEFREKLKNASASLCSGPERMPQETLLAAHRETRKRALSAFPHSSRDPGTSSLHRPKTLVLDPLLIPGS